MLVIIRLGPPVIKPRKPLVYGVFHMYSSGIISYSDGPYVVHQLDNPMVLLQLFRLE